MNSKSKIFLFFIIGAFAGIFMMYLYNNYTIEKKNPDAYAKTSNTENSSKIETQKNENPSDNSSTIKALTNEKIVVDFVKKKHQLPDYYITKNQARNQGWDASKGNLCNVLPGKAIGGDRFNNREKRLPKGVEYYEADVNYNCGNRNADRIIFTKNGEVYLTKNHYRTFEKQ